MKADKTLLLIYLLLPFAASLFSRFSRQSSKLSIGSAATMLRILLLLALGHAVVLLGGEVSAHTTLVHGYPLDIFLTLNSFWYGFLITVEFCFLLAHWMCPASGPNSALVRFLVFFAQGFCSLLALSEHSATTGLFLVLAGTVFFYLVRFSIPVRDEEIGATVSSRMYVLFFLLGLLMIAWGITEFNTQALVFGKGSGSALGIRLWLLLVVLSIPLPPWSRWFARAVEYLPEGVALTLVIFLSTVALKLASLFSVAYPDLGWKQKLFLYALGIMGCCFSIARLFGAENRKQILGCLPNFFLSLVLVSVGVSKHVLVLSAYFACLFVPIFMGLVLSAPAAKARGGLQKLFAVFLFVIVLGLPGTPVYQIFSGIGARSLDLGVAYTIVFGLLWFFYFNANVYICRRIFMEHETFPEGGSPSSQLEGSPVLFAGYGIFLMLLVTVVTQIAGRLL